MPHLEISMGLMIDRSRWFVSMLVSTVLDSQQRQCVVSLELKDEI
jgi:hypothetical protein